MLIVAVRALILYILVLIVIRLMGKRQIGQMQPFELVITIIISELAAMPMSNTGIPLASGVIGILVLLAAERFLSLLSLNSEKARKLICGTPTILIENGRPVPLAMERLRININDLLEQMRGKGYANLSDVAYAILETNGTLSIIPKPETVPPSARVLGKHVPPNRLPITLILDGNINLKNLQLAKVSIEHLINEARKQNIHDLRDVFLAQMTTDGHIDFFTK